MRKIVITFGVAIAMLAATAGAAAAAPGGQPAAHGLDGRCFGKAVSTLAQSYPGAVAEHASNRP